MSLQVRNIAVTHTFKIEKACRELGYCPKRYKLADSLEHYLKSLQPRPSLPLSDSQLPQALVLLLMIGLGLALLMLCCILCQD
ncbi:hypothetical protein LDENG_00107670 [Lucifuga dentata]|nr:hypothetical protein LDENG_00107670 [Lucifuga dentata]